jgi:hypothetical protein
MQGSSTGQNFGLSPADLIVIPGEARSIGNRFITQIWAKGGRGLAGDEAQNLLSKVLKTLLPLHFYFILYLTTYLSIRLCHLQDYRRGNLWPGGGMHLP